MSAAKRDLNLWTVLAVVLVVGLSAVAGARFITAWAHHEVAAEFDRKVVATAPAGVADVLAEQEALLGEYGWVDRDAGVVALPIDRAMELVVEENAGGER